MLGISIELFAIGMLLIGIRWQLREVLKELRK